MAETTLTQEQIGWVVINIGHPRTGKSFIVGDTFFYTRKGAVKKFVDGSGSDWAYWKSKFNYRVEKSKQTITTI